MMKRKIRDLGILLIALVLAAAFVEHAGNARAQEAGAENAETAQQEKQLIVSVVEDLPVEAMENGQNNMDRFYISENLDEEEGLFDLGDSDVPLAAFPGGVKAKDTGSSDGVRHIALMGLFVLCMILYIFVRVRSEKKLFALRESAARAERQMMDMNRP